METICDFSANDFPHGGSPRRKSREIKKETVVCSRKQSRKYEGGKRERRRMQRRTENRGGSGQEIQDGGSGMERSVGGGGEGARKGEEQDVREETISHQKGLE